MRASAFVYPWDVVGDPDAAARLARLGVRQATLASAYHSTRALTPRHPGHRIVTAEHAAVLYPPDAARWKGRDLRPFQQSWVAGEDPYAEAAEALAGAGLQVHTWVVLAHNSRLGAEHPETSVVNAYGDRYPWAPCIAQDAVHAYLVDLAAEAAVRPGASGTELESCGWYGFAHLHAHDKTAGVGLGDAAQYLMSLCFCPDCRSGYAGTGLDAGELAGAVRRALEPVWAGQGSGASGWSGVRELLGAGLADATRQWRDQVARRLQEAAVAAVRREAPDGFQVLLHADPAPYRTGANVGVDPAHILSTADGVVLPCTGGDAAREAVLGPFTGRGGVLAANFGVVSGMGGSPATLERDAAHARSLGATELRLYHAGLASGPDLDAVASALGRLAG
ncbi:hypothetical protein GA0115239_112617 [Streptomyces sp. BpilaLS-43]|uniref:hypothetical protein n=1 Tax=Streptomyces sp. BpilaLS-43 TaxID=1839778 RepID=UPI00081B45D5|nr:hypothetical protein [Streptomyces sp. BpilaLS-43]SCD93948.1 hypothetical protein GA0115239_112617 [Streptomyces sp. BpilaLS-43]